MSAVVEPEQLGYIMVNEIDLKQRPFNDTAVSSSIISSMYTNEENLLFALYPLANNFMLKLIIDLTAKIMAITHPVVPFLDILNGP